MAPTSGVADAVLRARKVLMGLSPGFLVRLRRLRRLRRSAFLPSLKHQYRVVANELRWRKGVVL